MWLPCEVQALAVAIATKHFSPYLIQSNHKARILTDSKPCIQAYEKLCRGDFSARPHESTFLSTMSCYQASIRHISGSGAREMWTQPDQFSNQQIPLHDQSIIVSSGSSSGYTCYMKTFQVVC